MVDFHFVDHIPARKTSNEEKISLTKRGTFHFLSFFFKGKNLERFNYVVLRYDKENKAVGFHFVVDKILGSLKLFNKSTTASVLSTSFWRDIALEPQDYSGKYTPQEYSADGKVTYYILLGEKNHEEGKT